ncbi:MAG: radical SAM protein [Myxococcota bacterium]
MGLLHRAFARSYADVWETENRLLHNVGMVRRPVAAQWLVTAACDLKCPHCYSEAGRRTAGELSTDEAKRLVIDPLVEMGCELLVLAGGELLLRRDIPELVAYAVDRGLSWSMHTHGGHVARFEALFRKYPPALAAVSLDGDRSFHDAFRGREGSYDAAFVAARVLADAGCREFVFGTTITRDNADAVADLFPRVARSRAHSWGLHLFAPEGRGHDHAELFPSPGQLRRVAAFARRRRAVFPIELCNEWGSAGIEDFYYRDQPFTCGAGSISLVISASGDLLPCTTTDPAEREGNVRQTPLPVLWKGQFGRFRSGQCLERGECWLQSRNGVRSSEAAFGHVARPTPLWVERLPETPQLIRRIGSNRVLGSRSAAAVGLAAAGLVFLQGCTKPAPKADGASEVPRPADDAPPAPQTAPWTTGAIAAPSGFPGVLIRQARIHYESEPPYSDWGALRVALLACERGAVDACDGARSSLAHLGLNDGPRWSAHVDALQGNGTHAFDEALALLDAVESRPTYDAAFAGHLWRRMRALPVDTPAKSTARARFFARLHRHHRVIDALKRASATVGKPQLRPWLKKSMAPPDYDPLVLPKGHMRAAQRAFPEATATTWDTVATTIQVDGGPVTLARAGKVETIAEGKTIELSRLDVLFCPQARTLRSGTRALSIDAGAEVTLFDLHEWLATDDRDKLRALVASAAAGDTAPLDALQRDLGLAHALVRAHIEANPGASPLSTLLVAFDE